MILDLNNMPFGAGQLVKFMLADPRCTPDHVLILADGLEEMANELPPGSNYIAALRRNTSALRDIAPAYTRPPGKPLGDFDGNLTP
jgi:hypothetical protein